MPRQLTLERARLIVAYLERVEAWYAYGSSPGEALSKLYGELFPQEAS